MLLYQEELYSDVIDELKPLLEEHYKEVALYQEHIDLNPNYALYEQMNMQGMIHIFTVRDTEYHDKLVGYCVTCIQSNPHYQDHLYAANDVVYVDPDYRHTEVAPEMISRVEQAMLDKGVSVMTFHMKTYKPFQTLMDALGFEEVEHVYSKYIKG